MAALPTAASFVPLRHKGIHMSSTQIIGLTIASLACVTDLRTRRIPNVLTFGAALAGLLYQFANGGIDGLGNGALGLFVGALIFILPFALGGLGGGDVKLLAALGAWLGPETVLWLSLYAGVAGGVMALVVSAMYGYSAPPSRTSDCSCVTGASPGSKPCRRSRSSTVEARSWRTRFRF